MRLRCLDDQYKAATGGRTDLADYNVYGYGNRQVIEPTKGESHVMYERFCPRQKH